MARRWHLLLVAAVFTAAFFFLWRDRMVAGAGSRTEPRNASAGVVSTPAANAAGEAAAQNAVTPRRTLFSYVRPVNADALDAALPAPARALHYVRLNTDFVAGKQSPFWQGPGEGRVTLPLPDGSALMLAIDGSEMLGVDRFTSVGRIDGRPASRAVFAYHAGFLHASIEDPELGRFVLRAATEDVSQFYRIDPALEKPCGGEVRPDLNGVPQPQAPRRSAATAGDFSPLDAHAPGVASAENPQRAEVHVMMLYTQAVLPTLSGAARTAALQSAFDLEIARTNVSLSSSLVTARLKLVKILETHYDETKSLSNRVQEDALTALYKTDDNKMDEIHAVRDAVGADIVGLAMQRFDFTSSGLSFLLDTPTDSRNSLFSFSVVSYTDLAGSTLLAHEFGHVFGCAHARGDAGTTGGGQGAYSYSYGYRFTGDGKPGEGKKLYRDIMAYLPGEQLSYFSNPDVIPPGVNAPIGVPVGQPGEANTALTIEQNAFAVASYRLQTQAVANSGTLINVATRAFVGRDEQVLIGGFVVQGTQATRLLIRGAGPALGDFGVTNALADPIVRVFSAAAQIATNDNWSANAAEVSPASEQVAAFPFRAGSADAALVVTLNPGAYSAIVEGASGTTGAGLVEVYNIDRSANAIVNLATRGYADNHGKEMHGGFVIAAAPGATKRVLIRVLGPTLERDFKITGALRDPFMELRNAAGQLLLENDDWSSGSSLGATNEVNDFSPLVELYNEEQITATGFAPKNRREPCALVDLPAGNYTVVVKPFEFRDPDPDFDQPAQPGVGIVEVYEIKQ